MRTIYFLDGLGSNSHYTAGLKERLLTVGLELCYMNYPEEGFVSLDDLSRWFMHHIADDAAIVMGFSLGADLATYLAQQCPQIKQLILLDGGLTVHAIDSISLEDEINQALAYLASQTTTDLDAVMEQEKAEAKAWKAFMTDAVAASYRYDGAVYRLRLSETAVRQLLTTRRACYESYCQGSLQANTLVCLAGQPMAYRDEKLARLTSYDDLTIQVFEEAGHQLYLEAEEALVSRIQEFLGDER